MATFGATAGQIDPSRDPLAQALANSGQLLGQGIVTGAQGYTQGKQKQAELKAAQEQKRLAMMTAELNDIDSRADRMMKADGVDPAAVDSYALREKENIYRKYGAISGDRLAALNEPPQTTVQPKQPEPVGLGLEMKPPTEGQPQQESAHPDAVPQPPAPVSGLTFTSAPQIFAGARQNVETREQGKRDAQTLGSLQTKLQDEGYEGFKDKVPGLSQYDINNVGQARQALGVLQAYKENLNNAEAEKRARLAAGKDAYDNEGQLRREYNQIAKPYIEVIDNTKDIESLASQRTPSADFGLLQKYARLLSPGIVTESDMRNAARPGGVLEGFSAEVNRLTDGNPITDEQRERIMRAIRSMTANAERNLASVNSQYSDLATSYFGQGADARIINTRALPGNKAGGGGQPAPGTLKPGELR